MKKTKAVDIILNEFSQSDYAISITELSKKLKAKMNKTTVYRILDRLEKNDILHSFFDSTRSKKYAKGKKIIKSSDSFVTHPHFICEDCGISSCMPIELNIPSISNYKIKSSEHLIIGSCEKCMV